MNKRIYFILSVFGFVSLFWQCERRIRSVGIKKTDYTLLYALYRKTFLWWVCMIMLPAGVALIFYHKIFEYSYILGNIYNIMILVYVYIIGVIVTRKLYDWKISNGIDSI